MNAGTILFARHNDLLIIKLAGIIRYASLRDTSRSTASFQSFLKCCFQRADFQHVLIDLTETESIDSTNLGLLAQTAQFTLSRFNRKPIIFSTQPDINIILESVGFDQVFEILHQMPPADQPSLDELPAAIDSTGDPSRVVLNAHLALMAVSDKNKTVFRDVVELLQEQVARED
jgi:anti-anti-sigma factor